MLKSTQTVGYIFYKINIPCYDYNLFTSLMFLLCSALDAYKHRLDAGLLCVAKEANTEMKTF